MKSSNINGVTWSDVDFAVGVLHSMGLSGVSHEQSGSYAVTDPKEVHSTLFLGPATESTVFGDYTEGSEDFDAFLEELFVVLKDNETELEEKEHIIGQSADENGVGDDDKDFALCLLTSVDNEGITYSNDPVSESEETGFEEDFEDINPVVISSPRKKKKTLPLLNPELVLAASHAVTEEGRIVFGGAAAESILSKNEKEAPQSTNATSENKDSMSDSTENAVTSAADEAIPKPSRIIGYPNVRAAEEDEELPDGYSDIFWAEIETVEQVFEDSAEKVEEVLDKPKRRFVNTVASTAERISENAPSEKRAAQLMYAGAAVAFGTTVGVIAFFIRRAINKRY